MKKLFVWIYAVVMVSLIAAQVFAATVARTSVASSTAMIVTPKTITWTSLASGDSGVGVEAGYAKSISLQISGDFTATTVLVEGSNNGTTYFQLDDIEGTAISKTAAALIEIRDRPKYIRPRVSIGGVSTDVTGVMYLTK